jgi:hypothetical protein
VLVGGFVPLAVENLKVAVPPAPIEKTGVGGSDVAIIKST